MKQTVWSVIVASGLLLCTKAQAALGGLEITRENIGFSNDNLWAMVPRMLNWLFGFLGIIFLILMIAGGFVWMTAAGDEKKVATASKLITAAVIGLIIVGSAFAVTAFVGDTFGPK